MSTEPTRDGGPPKRPTGWWVGCLVAAALFYLLVDDSTPAAVARNPGVIRIFLLTVGKTGLVATFVLIAAVVAAWEHAGRYREPRRDGAAPAGTERGPTDGPGHPAAEAVHDGAHEPAPPPRKIKGRAAGAGGFRKGTAVRGDGAGRAMTDGPVGVTPRPAGGEGGGVELTTARFLNRGG